LRFSFPLNGDGEGSRELSFAKSRQGLLGGLGNGDSARQEGSGLVDPIVEYESARELMFAFALAWSSNGDASDVFDKGSREGNGVRNENELLEGEANMIGPGEEESDGDGGVTGEARGDSAVLVVEVLGFSLLFEQKNSGTDKVRRGGGRRDV
jgi:hypothetical protein